MRPLERRPPRRRTVQWLAWSLVVAGLGARALPADAATDKIVVGEFLLRCADGRADGAFVELVATGPGQTFDAALGVRLVGPSGATISDLPGAFARRAGQPWPEGQHFLIATAGFAALTGVAPDTVFDAPPTTGKGSIILYRKSGTTLQVLNRAEYISGSVFETPPPAGRSAVTVAPNILHWLPEPSPTRSDGVMARAPDCFTDAHRPIRITELATRCSGGSPAGGFVEIAPTSDNQGLDTDLALRALDHTGAPIFDVPLMSGTLAGTPWAPNRVWLAGDSLFTTPQGDRPDAVWPAPLDPVGGRVVLHGVDATGAEVVLSEVEYGTETLPVPPAGGSIFWDALSGRYVERSPSTPTDYFARAHAAQGCTAPSSIRIRELMTACEPGAVHDSYVDLIATGSDAVFDSTLVLVVHDASDSVTAVVPADFGSRAGTPWSVITNWLVATAGITNDFNAHADAVLPVTLDPIAGRIEIQRRLGGPTGTVETVQSLRWGGTFPPPPAGQALRWFSDTDYRLVPPQPGNSSGQVLRCPLASDTAIVVPVQGIEVCTGCWDGSQRGQYVRLDLVAGMRLDQSFVLRTFDRFGRLTGERTGLFASANVTKTLSTRSWLVTDPTYPAPAGSIDAVLPAPLDTLAGSVQVVSARLGVERASAVFRYGPTGNPVIPPGYCFRTLPTPSLGYPAPNSFNGGSVPNVVPGCHFTATLGPTDPRIGEVFVACSDSSLDDGYLELSGVDPDRTLDPRLSLRILDASGAVQQTFPHIFPAPLPPELHGAGPRTLLIGGPAFAGATGFAPDRTLAQPLTFTTGSVELYIEDPVISDQPGLQVVHLAPGTTPPLGRSLIPSGPVTTVSSRHPVALRLNGDAFEIPSPCRDTSLSIPMVLDKMALGCFDGDPRGQLLQLVSSGTDDTLTSAFELRAFDHGGALAGVVSPAFGAITGLAGPGGRSLLIARGDTPLPLAKDAVLGFTLDTLGGTITLVERRPTGERTSWSVDYPASDPHGLLMGSVRQRLVGSTWVRGSPLLRDWLGQTGSLTGCHWGTPEQPALEVHGVLGACGDGTLGPSYVEVRSTRDIHALAGLELRVNDAQVNETVPLFPGAHAFDVWPAGRSLLVATDAFAPAMGFTPDRALPIAFGTGAGGITVRLADPTFVSPTTLTNEPLDFASFPEPGRALVRTGTKLVVSAAPAPVTFDGITHALPPGCFVQSGSPDEVRISGAMFACASGSTNAQYVQVERTSATTTRTPDLRVRLLDHAGAVLGERDHLFPAGSTFWGHVSSFVVGGLDFRTAFGFTPDATLPAIMDSVGGTIQVVRAEAGVDRVLSELRYGPGGVAVPARAHALVLDHGTWSVDSLPHPLGFNGDGEVSAFCRLPCDAQRVQLSLTAAQSVLPATGSYADSYSGVDYALARGEFDVHSRFARAELLMSDRYSLTGAAAPETIETFIDALEAHKDSCFRNACFHGSRRLQLIVNGSVVDTLPASTTGQARLRARVAFTPGQTVLVQMLATADGQVNPSLEGRVQGRLGFGTTPAGTRVTSCGGYDSNLARVVGDAAFSLSPHTIAIDWHVNAPPGFTADVQRLDESEPEPVWRFRETRPVDASGLLRFTDVKTSAENTYRYRLAWSDAFGSYTSDEVIVRTPRLPSFALLGALPNPSHGTLRVGFELADPADVRVELFDLLGRRVRDVRTPLAAGAQSVVLDQGVRLAPGLYQVRLAAGGRTAKTTIVVLP